jgi:hypothetical protein
VKIANESNCRNFRVEAPRGARPEVSSRRRVAWATRHISTGASRTVYRPRVRHPRTILASAGSHASLAAAVVALAALGASCANVRRGEDFVVPDENFDADFFFCRVEPEVIFAKKCGPGDPGAGDSSNGCHFNSSAVSGMAITNHPPIECADGHPVNRGQIGAGSAAQGNLQSVSLEMSRDVATAPLYVRPTGNNHPRAIFQKDDPVVEVIRQWAAR